MVAIANEFLHSYYCDLYPVVLHGWRLLLHSVPYIICTVLIYFSSVSVCTFCRKAVRVENNFYGSIASAVYQSISNDSFLFSALHKPKKIGTKRPSPVSPQQTKINCDDMLCVLVCQRCKLFLKQLVATGAKPRRFLPTAWPLWENFLNVIIKNDTLSKEKEW